MSATFEANGIEITLAHGHRTMFHYMVDKWAYITRGYLFKRYYDHLAVDFPTADVIILVTPITRPHSGWKTACFSIPAQLIPARITASRRNSAF